MGSSFGPNGLPGISVEALHFLWPLRRHVFHHEEGVEMTKTSNAFEESFGTKDSVQTLKEKLEEGIAGKPQFFVLRALLE